jgi:hypothetical protein
MQIMIYPLNDKKELKRYIEESTKNWKIFIFKKNQITHLPSLINFLEKIIVTPKGNDIKTENLRTLDISRVVTIISYTISKFNQQLDFQTMECSFSEFDLLFFKIKKPGIDSS